MGKEIVEIRGIKFEVDIDSARRITEFRVGDAVKVLKKKYSDKWEAHPGVVVGFDAFRNLPTVVVAYLEIDYSGAKLCYESFNQNSDDVEIAPMVNQEALSMDKGRVVDLLDKEIEKKKLELRESELKKTHFLSMFGRYFETPKSDPSGESVLQ